MLRNPDLFMNEKQGLRLAVLAWNLRRHGMINDRLLENLDIVSQAWLMCLRIRAICDVLLETEQFTFGQQTAEHRAHCAVISGTKWGCWPKKNHLRTCQVTLFNDQNITQNFIIFKTSHFSPRPNFLQFIELVYFKGWMKQMSPTDCSWNSSWRVGSSRTSPRPRKNYWLCNSDSGNLGNENYKQVS